MADLLISLMVPMTEYFSVRRRKLHLGLLSDLKRFPLTMPFSLARKVVSLFVPSHTSKLHVN